MGVRQAVRAVDSTEGLPGSVFIGIVAAYKAPTYHHTRR